MSAESKPDLSASISSAAAAFDSTPDLDLDSSDVRFDLDDDSPEPPSAADPLSADASAAAAAATAAGPPPAPKRKGGRKPIYATSEERKQRNRQAQAAFRERRTEYIKQLEIAIKQHEDSLQTLQHNHRAAADECLMLRYKNSLLERILLEKGIDVQAELASKGEPTSVRPVPMMSHPPPPTAQRAIMNRHQQAQRSIPGLAPKLHIKQDGAGMHQHHHTLSSGGSTSSQLASPSTTFSTPRTGHAHSAATSPSFSPHSEGFHHRLSGQFHMSQQTPTSATGMPPFPYSGQGDSTPQQFDFQTAPFAAYDMSQSAISEPGPAYPAWMDQAEYNPSGLENFSATWESAIDDNVCAFEDFDPLATATATAAAAAAAAADAHELSADLEAAFD